MFWLGMLIGAVIGWLFCALNNLARFYELQKLVMETIEQMHADQRAEYDRRFREIP